jgi:hypothetical protein
MTSIKRKYPVAKGYAEKYRMDGRPVTKVGIAFSSEKRNITEWKSIAQ